MEIKGIIHITGEHDTGKSLAALGLCPPKQTAFIHDDIKIPPISLSEIGFPLNLVDGQVTFGNLRKYVLDKISSIEPKVKCIIFDTFTRFESSVQVWGKQNYHLTREKETMAPGDIYRWGQEWKEADYQVAKMINDLAKRFETIILVTHLKDHFEANVRTGKEIPASTKVLNRICNLRLWLRQNPDDNSGIPIALILKRLTKTVINDNGDMKVVNVLPRRIKPLASERSVWDAINRYWNDPVANRELNEDEKPTAYELSILDGVLTEDQKQVWKANLLLERQIEDTTSENQIEDTTSENQIEEKIKTLHQEGKNLLQIQQAFSEPPFNKNISPVKILEVIELNKKVS